jgi:hypothetical protein
MTQRRVKILTGEYGLRDFSQAVLQNGGNVLSSNFGNAVVTNFNAFSKGKSIPGVENPMKYGFQFTEFYAYNGITFEVTINPMQDDKVHFPELHPEGGTTESRRMTVIGLGGDPNVYQVKPKGWKPVMTYVPGIRNPFSGGGLGYSMAASSLDGYRVDFMDTVGCMIKDPTKIFDFVCNISL